MKPGDVVFIQWRDSTSIYGWKDRDEAKEKTTEGPLVCDAVGFLVSETQGHICLCAQKTPHQVADLTIVPKESIVRKRVLK